MKPLKITLILLGAVAGTAYAQSSVTIYGRIDMGVTKANSGTSNAANPGEGKADQWNIQQGQASSLGFRGQEDMGSGLYARFNLETRYLPNTGAQAFPTFWQGSSVVALGKRGYGEVYLGRDNNPAYNVALTADPTYWSYVSQLGNPYTYAGFNASATNNGGVFTSMDGAAVRHSNTVGYKSPSLSGVTAEAAVAAGEGNRKTVLGWSMQYRQGPISAGVGYDGVNGNNRLYIATAAYDFGLVRPIVSFGNAKGGASPTYAAKTATLSLESKIGAGKIYTGIGRLNSNGASNNSMKVFAGYQYRLSNHTTLYTNVGSAKTDGLTRATAFDMGFTQTF